MRGRREVVLCCRRHVDAACCDDSQLVRRGGEDRFEVEVVRDVHRDHPARCEVLDVRVQCLDREKMDRNGIRREGVEHDQVVEALAVLDGQATVGQYHLDGSVGLRQVSEEVWVLRDVHDSVIDLDECECVAGAAIRSESTGPETHDGDIHRPMPPHLDHDLTDGP